MAIKQEVNAPLILTVGIISAVLLLVVSFGTEAWFIREERDEIQDKWNKSSNVELTELKQAQIANIHRAGPTTVPIEKAVAAFVQAGGKMPAAAPVPAPAAGGKK